MVLNPFRNNGSHQPGNKWKRCVMLSAVTIFIFVAMDEIDVGSKKKEQLVNPSSNASNTNSHPDSQNWQQQQQQQQQQQLRGSQDDSDEKNVDTVKSKQDALKDAEQQIEAAEEYDLKEALSGVLQRSYSRVEDGVKFSIGKLFGNSDDVSEEDMEDVAKEVSKRLEKKAKDDLTNKANDLVHEKELELEKMADEKGTDEEDLKTKEQIIISDLQSDINEAATQTITYLKNDALQIEKDVIKEKLHKKVEIVDGKIQIVKKTESKEGDDNAKTNKTEDLDVTGDLESDKGKKVETEGGDNNGESTVDQHNHSSHEEVDHEGGDHKAETSKTEEGDASGDEESGNDDEVNSEGGNDDHENEDEDEDEGGGEDEDEDEGGGEDDDGGGEDDDNEEDGDVGESEDKAEDQ